MELTFIRHEESVGNVLAREASEQGLLQIDNPYRGPDIPLSEVGVQRAREINLNRLTYHISEYTIICSPYLRAQQTAATVLEPMYFFNTIIDERLRDRELGLLDGYTNAGIKKYFPAEWKAREKLGKFYHRPAGGESWADVVLRMRSFFNKLRELPGPYLIFSHDVPILAAIYLCNEMTEQEIIDYQKNSPVENGSITKLKI